MKLRSDFQIHGHRGCRGLFPENTIPAFEKASKLGVDALELDIVISKDRQVIVSHEPYFSHKYSTKPDGRPVRKYNEKSHNLFKLTKKQIQRYDVGIRQHPDFPKQQIIASHKPSLKETVMYIDKSRKKAKKKPMLYSIEIKRKKRWDKKYVPSVEMYVDLVIKELRSLRITKRTSLLCFDLEILESIHRKAPEITLVYLVDNLYSIERNMKRLSFKPDVFGPKFSLVNKKIVDYCDANGIDIVCWTVNTIKDMKKLIRLGVKGITTDYPDTLIELVQTMRRS